MMVRAPVKTSALSSYPKPFAEANQSPRAVPSVWETDTAIQKNSTGAGLVIVSTDTEPSNAYQRQKTAPSDIKKRSVPPEKPMPNVRSTKSAIAVPNIVEVTIAVQNRSGQNSLMRT